MGLSLNEIRLDSNYINCQKHKTPKTVPKSDKRFLKGPIPWKWLSSASRLPGKTLQVALALLFVAGLTKSHTVKIQKKILDELGVSRKGYYRAIKRLEESGLISVETKQGCHASICLRTSK